MSKMSKTKLAYLNAVQDWSTAYEVAARLGRLSANHVKPYLGRLIGEGLVTWSRANATYRITPSGRAALSHEGE